MSEHRASISWSRETPDFSYDSYSRDHKWTFEEGVEIRASAAPDFLGTPALVDPEEAFVASVASCHMLTFLAIAARKRLKVDEYRDHAVGTLEKNAQGRLAITRVVLKPRVSFGGSESPSEGDLLRIHQLAHENCFIANSVRASVVVDSHRVVPLESSGR
jgi:organic hydroperoxide reductase OsmC/OhrA